MVDKTEARKITFEELRKAVEGSDVAIRVVTKLMPAGGPGDKVFPPTYEGGKYATEKRRVGDREVDTVLLDSVQSQANRMELALKAAFEQGGVKFPLLSVDFSEEFPQIGVVTALDAPHRIADAILRDSLVDGKPFRKSPEGQAFSAARVSSATALFELCPTALIFGVWDSTGPLGGMGGKFARAIVSEIVGYDAVQGVKTESRIDPLQIPLEAGPIFALESGGWTISPDAAKKDPKTGEPVFYGSAKDTKKRGKPSTINHGNITPQTILDGGGFTISHAIQTTVLSLPALRRLRFPLANSKPDAQVDQAARTALAALALTAIAYQREEGYDLRSRCLLVPADRPIFELLTGDGTAPSQFEFGTAEARSLFMQAIEAARKASLPWRDNAPIMLKPGPDLVELVRRSIAIQASSLQAES